MSELKVKFSLINVDGAPAYDVEVLDATATLGDYVAALDSFQEQVMADCRGCVGCCQERVPLTIADYELARGLGGEDISLYQWLVAVGDLGQVGEALDITLKRSPDGSCHWLDLANACCSQHRYRTFACRTHCCLNKTPLALDLRGEIINSGEDALIWQIFSGDWQGQLPPAWVQRLAQCNPDDYGTPQAKAYLGEKWKNLKLQNVLSEPLWGKLF